MNKETKGTGKVKKIFNASISIRLARWIGKILPRELGLKIASFIGSLIGLNQWGSKAKAIRANQWVIHDQSLTKAQLKKKPKVIFSSASKCMFDYFYFLTRPDELQQIIDISPEAEVAYERIRRKEASVCVCPHISNFDLMGYALSLQGLEVQVISYPDPNASYKMQNAIRQSVGITVTPMSLSAFREARNRLREGGAILTGLDRPPDKPRPEKEQLVFFGHDCNLTAPYVRLAIDANAPVIVLAATSQPGGRYQLESSPLIWMETEGDFDDVITHNANRVLKQSEGMIKRNADQWAMFYPVWPQFLGK